MPRAIEDIIAGVREAAGAFKPAGINIPTDELLALCETAEKYQQIAEAFARASEYHQTLEAQLEAAGERLMGEDL